MSNITIVHGDSALDVDIEVDSCMIDTLLYIIASDTTCLQLTTSDTGTAEVVEFCFDIGANIQVDDEADVTNISFNREQLRAGLSKRFAELNDGMQTGWAA